jgi:tRNA-2-methylthio-N6-dimethylallyladenosine synthase
MKRYIVQTFGCQMNVHDSRRIEEVLGHAGYEVTDDAALADAIVFNTCSVREKAEHKLLSILGTVRPLKEERPDLCVVVAGCVAQQEGERLLQRAPLIDVVLGPDNIEELPALIDRSRSGAPPIARTVFDLDDPRFLVAAPRADHREVTSFVTVMKGCDERCTFCVVPYTRGPERYRASSEIVSEIQAMVAGGVREVTLLGQTVNSWHEPGETEASESAFASLLRLIAKEVPGLARLRYTSPHPRHVTDALVRAHAELEVLPAHVHLPVQSGSNRVLKRMLRRYTREHYVARAAALKAARPGLTLSTDFIVGFPGETESDLEETLSLVREVGFSAAFAFKYSPRPHTPALKLDDDVTEDEKDARLARLFEVVAEGQTAHLQSLAGARVEVLVEGPGKGAPGRYRGRSERHEIVHVDVPPDRDPTGLVLPVRIEQANAHSLLGRVEADVLALPLRVERAPVAPKMRSLRKLPMLGTGALEEERHS